MFRTLLDLSALILIRQAKLLRRLGKEVKHGRVAATKRGLNKLRRNPKWREWVERHEHLVAVSLATDEEHALYYSLMVAYGSVGSNPYIADDDLIALTIAAKRHFPLVIRDRAAENVGRQHGVQFVTVAEYISDLQA